MNLNENKQDLLLSDLLSGLAQLNIETTVSQQTLLIDYLHLLEQWNKSYNLTAIKDIGEMLYRHILDSLVIAPYCEGNSFIDVGTGAGLPGIPLAILFPDKKFTLLDSNGKKTRFLFHIKTTLNLSNVSVEQSRVESYKPDHLFDGVLSRAFASIGDMLQGSEHLLESQGCFYAMKGQNPIREIDSLPDRYFVEKNYLLTVPGIDAERHLLVVRKKK